MTKLKTKLTNQIDFRKGTGTFVLGWYMMLMCLFIAVVLIDQFVKYNDGLQSQMAVDSVADGSAAYATSIASGDDDEVEEQILERAEEINTLIEDETDIDEIYDYNYLVEYGNYQVTNNNHDGSIDATMTTHYPNTYGNFADLFNVDDGDEDYYSITRHTKAYFSRLVGSQYSTVSEAELSADHIHYNQYDTRWGTKPYYYSSSSNWNTIARSGCGPTSLAMVATELKRNANGGTISDSEAITPDEACDFAATHGCHVEGQNGTSNALFTNNSLLGYYYLNGREIARSEAAMKEALDNGSLLIISVGNGTYTGNSHLMVICEYDSSGFLINDPNYGASKPYRVDFTYLMSQGNLQKVFELWWVG